MFLNVPKLREVLEERINWFLYGAEQNSESQGSLDGFKIVLEELEKKEKHFVLDLQTSIAKISSELAGKYALEEDDTIVRPILAKIGALNFVQAKLEEGEFDLFEEKERE